MAGGLRLTLDLVNDLAARIACVEHLAERGLGVRLSLPRGLHRAVDVEGGARRNRGRRPDVDVTATPATATTGDHRRGHGEAGRYD
jgi:hypothetical protein